jgi:hypothetical protein
MFSPGDDGLDSIDRLGVAFGGEPRTFLPMKILQVEVAVIESVGQMRGRP